MIFINTPMMIYVLLGLVILLLIWIINLEIRIKKFLAGKDGKSLEDSVASLHKSIAGLSHFQEEAVKYFNTVESRLKRSIQAIETIRFNPFKGTGSGGNQSFSTALLNEKGDGVVISSLYSRDHISLFSKPLKKFSSIFEMTHEEQSVVETAKEALKSSSPTLK